MLRRHEPMVKTIGTAIESVLKQLGIGEKLRQYEVLDLWGSIVGDQIAKATKAESIREGKLYVRVTHAAWRNELVYLKKEIIDKINGEMKQKIVKDIIFH